MGRNKGRKQRVALRQRRREALQERVRTAFVRTVILALGAGFALGVASQGGNFFGGFLRKHTPEVEIHAPQTLAGPPPVLDWPKQRFWLWFPGISDFAGHQLQRRNTAIHAVRFDKDPMGNRIVVRVEPRMPLVRWETSGMDREGVVFPIQPGSWSQLPMAHLMPEADHALVGKWLAGLAAHEALWSQVGAVSQDPRGSMMIDMKTGARLQWGLPDSRETSEKIATLNQVLEDAHQHLGGAAIADLRFFAQGRIIVRPKGVRGE